MTHSKENPSSFYARLIDLPAGLPPWSRGAAAVPEQTENQFALSGPVVNATARYTGFRSAGVHDMSNYSLSDNTTRPPTSTPGATGNGPGPPPAFATLPARAAPSGTDTLSAGRSRLSTAEAALEAQLKAGRATTAAAAARAAPRLAPDNVGYKLLKAAGWSEGRGLGREEQGPVVPIAATRNPGAQGIGFHKQQQKQQVVILSSAPASGSAPVQGEGQGAPHVQAVVVRRVDIKQLVEQELAAETTEAKVDRHRAAMHAEAEAQRGRATTRALYRAFDDPFDNVGSSTANTNPLGKKTRLTATNPLLQSDDEDG